MSMTETVDQIFDRRNLRRKVTFWRIAAFVALVAALVAALWAGGLFSGQGASGDHIARVSISGVIQQDRPLLEMLEKIEKDDSVKGVVLTINSPGGTTVGGEDIFNAVRKVAEKKPVAASVGTLAASAGYMIATGSDHIVARRSSIVGSIGVIFQYPQAHKLLDKIGVSLEEVKSAPLKAEPSPFHVPPPGAIAVIEELIDDSYQWFVDLVTDRRPLNRAEVLALADGRIMSGDRGVETKLIDAIGDEEAARKWITAKDGIADDLELVDWNPKRKEDSLFFRSQARAWVAQQLGLPAAALPDEALDRIIPKRLFLDGLLSLWQG
ncbi:signal peptide peptidase SppA [Ahrensia sp. R2A130]|uniref:signal peptide peptidase SppA n=1 Tax=Ahrensia sp. R2A130 TaxID=744979 RepID=UPI0001E0D82C|nr:signal peptide peptidase SppA [Ahrensia sp. R2A130]EFL89789.1 signal peptide peptidase A [Ahrensia sp. R2A130]